MATKVFETQKENFKMKKQFKTENKDLQLKKKLFRTTFQIQDFFQLEIFVFVSILLIYFWTNFMAPI